MIILETIGTALGFVVSALVLLLCLYVVGTIIVFFEKVPIELKRIADALEKNDSNYDKGYHDGVYDTEIKYRDK